MSDEPTRTSDGSQSLETASTADEQKQQAVETAEAFLAGGREEATQRAYAIRFIAVDSGPLTPDQQKREPSFIEKAQARFARYEVQFDPNQPRSSFTIRYAIV
jgi:hypothetical protein